jgi:hypothetical protein
MITVAIAVRDTAAAKQYRALLMDSGIDAHFASDIPTLIRSVKGRPIDVVIFDLARNALSINSWLVEVGRDRDLALAPVLWIGAGILPEMKRIVEEYRPGMYLPRLPGLEDLKTAINTLIGRVPQMVSAPTSPNSDPIDEPIWKPGDRNIDDALSIFAEGGKGSASGTPARPAAPGHPEPVSAPTVTAGMSEVELDAVAERICSRLASDILKRLNRDDLRRMIEQALTETSIPIS